MAAPNLVVGNISFLATLATPKTAVGTVFFLEIETIEHCPSPPELQEHRPWAVRNFRKRPRRKPGIPHTRDKQIVPGLFHRPVWRHTLRKTLPRADSGCRTWHKSPPSDFLLYVCRSFCRTSSPLLFPVHNSGKPYNPPACISTKYYLAVYYALIALINALTVYC